MFYIAIITITIFHSLVGIGVLTLMYGITTGVLSDILSVHSFALFMVGVVYGWPCIVILFSHARVAVIAKYHAKKILKLQVKGELNKQEHGLSNTQNNNKKKSLRMKFDVLKGVAKTNYNLSKNNLQNTLAANSEVEFNVASTTMQSASIYDDGTREMNTDASRVKQKPRRSLDKIRLRISLRSKRQKRSLRRSTKVNPLAGKSEDGMEDRMKNPTIQSKSRTGSTLSSDGIHIENSWTTDHSMDCIKNIPSLSQSTNKIVFATSLCENPPKIKQRTQRLENVLLVRKYNPSGNLLTKKNKPQNISPTKDNPQNIFLVKENDSESFLPTTKKITKNILLTIENRPDNIHSENESRNKRKLQRTNNIYVERRVRKMVTFKDSQTTSQETDDNPSNYSLTQNIKHKNSIPLADKEDLKLDSGKHILFDKKDESNISQSSNTTIATAEGRAMKGRQLSDVVKQKIDISRQKRLIQKELLKTIQHIRRLRCELKATILLTIVMVIFLSLWLPYWYIYVMMVSGTFTGDNGIGSPSHKRNCRMAKYFKLLHYVNSVINPIYYALLNSKLRKSLKKIFKKFCVSRHRRKIEKNREIRNDVVSLPKD